ncbi:hypothetical protein R3W88_014757 [Solanum pinnatisectum]|uniref:Uncharacterized protein n=1 Tax=Solanum pinnatisectum TaxID=50273 RepID=A0AAV9KV06_9SOLN|nr:hypothetical protein R3W88_014757 [Solanum pinnatisectum]
MRVNIACIQETKWVGSIARDVDKYKLWYSGSTSSRNEIELYGHDEEDKKHFWEDLDDVVRGVSHIQKLFRRGDFNYHIEYTPMANNNVYRGLDLGDINSRGVSLLDFARVFGLVVAEFEFLKEEDLLVTFISLMAKTQIAFYAEVVRHDMTQL